MVGDLVNVQSSSTSIEFTILRPGTEHVVRYAPGDTTAVVTTESADVVGFLNRLHHVTGTWHDAWVISAWTWFMAVVSVMLFGIGLTGIAMWFMRKKERGVGYVLLALSVGGGGGLAVLIRFLS